MNWYEIASPLWNIASYSTGDRNDRESNDHSRHVAGRLFLLKKLLASVLDGKGQVKNLPLIIKVSCQRNIE